MDFMTLIDASRFLKICLNYEMNTCIHTRLHTLNYDKPYVWANNVERRNESQSSPELRGMKEGTMNTLGESGAGWRGLIILNLCYMSTKSLVRN